MSHKTIGLYEDEQLAAFQAARGRVEDVYDDADLRDGDVIREVCEVYMTFIEKGELPDWATDFGQSPASTTCRNCGATVSKKYVDVFEPEGVDRPRVCPFCPDKVRDERFEEGFRDIRSKRHGRTGKVI